MKLTSIEICAGAGGQALGLEQAGFEHLALVEIDHHACKTLRSNRPHWDVQECDLKNFSGFQFQGKIDLLAGGVPCPPFSRAGKQLGHKDERDLFPEALRLVEEIQPKAVMLENVRGLLDDAFTSYRNKISKKLRSLGYVPEWRLLHASDYGVPQLRPRVIMVAIKRDHAKVFDWPEPLPETTPTVGEAIGDLMGENGWLLAKRWSEWANQIAPTLVGGSKKHGGPDLGPTRAKRAWSTLAVDGHGIADAAPEKDFKSFPKITIRMAARIQGFPDDWLFTGGKTASYRQIGNAFPPPVAKAVGNKIAEILRRNNQK